MTEHVRGQLEFGFSNDDGIGTLDEAMELWDSVRGNSYGESAPPPGWDCIGRGGTRVAYRSPSGVCYKICHDNNEVRMNHNDTEHKNFQRIRREGKLPANWRVPKSRLHVFTANMRRWDYNLREEVSTTGQVVILACEYIAGPTIGWEDPHHDEMRKAFSAVGLVDTGGANAIKSESGIGYIIDAAEWMEPEN